MTLWYDEDRHAIVENTPEYAEDGENGELVLSVEDMRGEEGTAKLRNLIGAAEDALEESEGRIDD